MSERNLQKIVDNLRSEKVKERQEAAVNLREVLENDRLVESIASNASSDVWLILYQALFDASLTEKRACTKNGSITTATTGAAAQALRRLEGLSKLVRVLVGRTFDALNGKAMRSVLEHMYSQLRYQGRLIEDVSLNYIKAIETLLSHGPHLDRLEETNWIKIVELCFNVILGDPFKTRLENDIEEDSQGPGDASSEGEESPGDSEMDTDDQPGTSRKRKHSAAPRRTQAARASPALTSSASGSFQAASREQIALASLLRILLASPIAPLTSSSFPFIPAAVLNRLERFVSVCPNSSMIQQDLLQALSASLSRLALNKRDLVVKFARNSWERLVDMWGMRDHNAREHLIVVLKVLFPYYTLDKDVHTLASAGYADGVTKLWRTLDINHSRQGTDSLSLDALRLQLRSETEQARPAFVTNTFRNGWHFDDQQALLWATLELQADSVAKLFLVSESSLTGRADGKRTRQEDPVTTMMQNIMRHSEIHTRVWRLQLLLFFVDRHWTVIHGSLQSAIINDLLQILSHDDASVQSWCFMCLAAIGHATSITRDATQALSEDHGPWDAVWTHAMRRSNVPTVCRAACHVAHVLLRHNKVLLSPPRVMSEIETFAKDLDVQGPSFPYDSVCAFMVLCIRVASQDVHLYRMTIETKVLTWAVGVWRPDVTSPKRMPLYTVQDIFGLLGAVCAVNKLAELLCELPLPDSVVAGAVIEEHTTTVIRDFQLYARLPPFNNLMKTGSVPANNLNISWNPPEGLLAEPQQRERRISAHLQKTLDEYSTRSVSSESLKVSYPEQIRTMLDWGIIALCFEALLFMNGIQPNRRVIQSACKLISLATPRILDSSWTPTERAIMVSAFQPLILAEPRDQDILLYETLLPPCEDSGIRREILRSLMLDTQTSTHSSLVARRAIQRAVLRSSDVQDTIQDVLQVMRNLLRLATDQPLPEESHMGRDIGWDTRVAQEPGSSSRVASNDLSACPDIISRLIDTCISCLTIFPALQSSSGEPTRDKELSQILLDGGDKAFLLLAPSYFDSIKQRTLNIKPSALETLQDKFAMMLVDYRFTRSPRFQMLVIHFLHTTMHIWIPEAVADMQAGDNAGSLCSWLMQVKSADKLGVWQVRERLVCFMDDYVAADPQLRSWPKTSSKGGVLQPPEVLPMMCGDEDIRVRMRAAVANPRIIQYSLEFNLKPDQLYDLIRKNLCRSIELYEEMLTRLLCLANATIVNSEVRRGPYWNLLETCLYTDHYIPHIEQIFAGVAARLGLPSYSALFEAYASQIAFSIRQAGKDLLLLPPHLLGYKDRKQCAESAFSAFTPQNLSIHGTSEESIAHGRHLFAAHCSVIKKAMDEGLRECAADVIGLEMVYFAHHNLEHRDGDQNDLHNLIHSIANNPGTTSSALEDCLQSRADGIIFAVIRTFDAMDSSPGGAAIHAMTCWSSKLAECFLHLTELCSMSRFRAHEPNIPSVPARTIFATLRWFYRCIQVKDDTALVYHVLHRLFAELERTHFVNEQIRLLNTICLWVACHYAIFENTTLRRMLSRGAANLLTQYDLVRGAQSILQRVLSRVEEDIGIAELLIRIGRSAHDLSTSRDQEIAETGLDLLDWIEAEALRLGRSPNLHAAVQQALTAWPRDLNASLQSISKEPTGEDISVVLADRRIMSNKFRLVRQLRQLVGQDLYDVNQFGRSDFWRLKDLIPAPENLSDEDIASFAQLLLSCSASIDALDSGFDSRENILDIHLQATKQRDVKYTIAARRAIMTSLLLRLDTTYASQVHLAFVTLRAIMGVDLGIDQPGTGSGHHWSSLQQAQLTLIQEYARPSARPRIELHAALVWGNHLELVRDFSAWIKHITTALSDHLSSTDTFYACLSQMLEADVDFARDILPIMVHTSLQDEHPHQPSSSSGPSCHDVLSDYFSHILASDVACNDSRLAVINTVLHLRSFNLFGNMSTNPLAYDKWLRVDHLLLSRNAILCGSYTTALLFLELAMEYKSLAERDPAVIEQVLYDIYGHIDEPDGFYGIETQDLHEFLLHSFHHEGRWDRAFQFHGAAIEAKTTSSNIQGLLQSLHSFGFDHLAMSTLQTTPEVDEMLNNSPMTYNLGWRTATWDLPERNRQQNSGVSLYLALKALNRERDQFVVDSTLRKALYDEAQALHALGDENVVEVRRVAQNLMCLEQVRQWLRPEFQQSLREKALHVGNLAAFCQTIDGVEFPDAEAVMATRVVLLRSVRQQEQSGQLGDLLTPFAQNLIDAETALLLRLSEAAREAGREQLALNAIVQARQLPNSSANFDLSHEYANVLWLMKEPNLAVQLLKSGLRSFTQSASAESTSILAKKARVYALLGMWTAEACLEKPAHIKADYFDTAVSFVDQLHKMKSASPPIPSSVYRDYAVFAERQYHAIVKAPDSLKWKILVDRKTQEIRNFEAGIKSLRQASSEYRQLVKDKERSERILAEDTKQYEAYIKTRDAFLDRAIEMHSRCLATSEQFDDDSGIRLCSLWFANFDYIENRFQAKISRALHQVPSHKFVFLTHQLSARLSNVGRSSAQPEQTKTFNNAYDLVLRMCRDHPFHCLYSVHSLKVDASPTNASSSMRRSSRHETSSSQAARAAAAIDIFSSLSSHERCAPRAAAVEKACDAALEWAKYPLREKVKAKIRIVNVPSHALLMKLKDVKVPVITARTPLDPTCEYADCVWMHRYDPKFTMAGGKNMPKITVCIGSDGVRYKQLFKGEGDDDLRQDAVMEQVFELVNIVLKRDRATTKRDLHIRTYKVIPLASQAGVLEFVENTTPLGSWLVNAHQIYAPAPPGKYAVWKEIHDAIDDAYAQKSEEGRVAVFQEICNTWKPVMRHYFTEKHKTPMKWFRMRLNYARTLATSSVVGHILGLGDRHLSNILIHERSGEIVPIDLGIAFEQGKLLPIPERVPFRLTRDMVDGLGTTGTKGVFQRCAEETLRVLRDGSEVILTVLEVFKYDPLHSWTASEMKLKQVQSIEMQNSLTTEAMRFVAGLDMSAGMADEAADRALSSVMRKLDKTLSVQFTVNELIAEATDVTNLALMFHGWSAWC